jgi:hypothetical protein
MPLLSTDANGHAVGTEHQRQFLLSWNEHLPAPMVNNVWEVVWLQQYPKLLTSYVAKERLGLYRLFMDQ